MSLFEEVDDYEEQLKELIGKIQASLENELPNLTGKARMDKCNYIKGRIDRVRQIYQSLKVELRELPKAEAREYEKRARDYEQQISDLQTDLDRAKEFAQQISEMAGGGKTVDQLSTKEAVELAKKVQEQSKQSTERSKQIVEETLDVGAATALQVKAQTEQLNRIDKQVEVVDSNVALAEKQLRAFMRLGSGRLGPRRRMATDKLIMVMVCLVVLGIIAAIVVAIVKSQQSSSTATPSVSPINITATPTP